jgi:hypothetical protein
VSITTEVAWFACYACGLLLGACALDRLARHSHNRSDRYRTAGFRYHPDHDAWVCPQDQMLWPTLYDEQAKLMRYRAKPSICNACPVKTSCTTSDRGRTIQRSISESYLETVRSYHATEPYKKAIRKRQVWVEPLFAEAKEWHGLRRLRLRGLLNANIQGLLIASGQNLKRFLAATGWGRRHAPCGSLLAIPGEPWTVSIGS